MCKELSFYKEMLTIYVEPYGWSTILVKKYLISLNIFSAKICVIDRYGSKFIHCGFRFNFGSFGVYGNKYVHNSGLA